MTRLKAREGFRLLSNMLRIPHFCNRAACRRANACRENPKRCLALYANRVPLEAREFVIDLLNAREFGFTFEEAMKRDRQGAEALAAWQARAQNSFVVPGRQ